MLGDISTEHRAQRGEAAIKTTDQTFLTADNADLAD